MKKTLLSISILFAVVICHTSIAGTSYVDQNHPSASDQNSGSAGSPWLTILHAMSSANPGDTIVVKGNTPDSPVVYDEWIRIPAGVTGEEGSMIVLKAEPSRSVVFQGIDTRECDYLRIEGFQITNDNTTWNKKLGVHLTSNNVEIVNNHFFDLRHYPAVRGAKSCNDILVKDNLIERCNVGFWADGNRWRVENNTVYRLMRSEIGTDADYARFAGEDIQFIGNYFYGSRIPEETLTSHVDGFQTFSLGEPHHRAHNVLIANNVVMDFHQGIMMRDVTCEGVEGAVSETHTNWTIVNNVFARGRSFGIDINHVDGVSFLNNTVYDMVYYGVSMTYCRNAKIINNIVQKTYHPFRGFETNYEGHVADYNIIYDWTAGRVDGADAENNLVGEDPMLLNPENGDFRLMEGSPAINNGLDVSAYGVTEDMLGNSRPYEGGWDIGAYEFSGGNDDNGDNGGNDDNGDNGNDNQNGSDDDNDGENNVESSNDDEEQTITQVHAQTGHQLALYQNYPNPFSHSTTITFEAPATSHYILVVYDITGKIVATLLNETKEAGRHSVAMNSSQYNLSNGVYFYRLIAGDGSYTMNRMMKLK